MYDSMLSKHNHFARGRDHEGWHHRARLLAIHSASLSAGAWLSLGCPVGGPIRNPVDTMSVGGSIGRLVAIDLNTAKLLVQGGPVDPI